MSKNIQRVTIGVTLDESIHKLQDLCNEIRQLSDLVPEWNRLEAEEHEENIQEILFDLIKTNGLN